MDFKRAFYISRQMSGADTFPSNYFRTRLYKNSKGIGADADCAPWVKAWRRMLRVQAETVQSEQELLGGESRGSCLSTVARAAIGTGRGVVELGVGPAFGPAVGGRLTAGRCGLTSTGTKTDDRGRDPRPRFWQSGSVWAV